MMYTKVSEADVDLFVQPARILASGYSSSGKTTLLVSIIKKYRHKFNRVILLGGDLDVDEELKIEKIDDFNPFEEHLIGANLLIFDDCIYNKKLLTLAGEIFVRGRHLQLSVAFVSQNLFLADKNFRQISLNCTHIIILRHRDEKQIICFARSFLSDGKVKQFLNLYKKVVVKHRYQYLLVDFTADIESPLAIRTSITGTTPYEKVFLLD